MMKVLKFILENWYLILIAGVLIGGFIYRKVTHQPFKGDIPPVGVMNDMFIKDIFFDWEHMASEEWTKAVNYT